MMEYMITNMNVRQEHDVMGVMGGAMSFPTDLYVDLTLLITEHDGLSIENFEEALKNCSKFNKFNGHKFSKDMIETALEKTYPEYFI
jgi:hypothetical protein